MDPRRNPFAPGAGTPPPELAGRAQLIDRATIAIDRIVSGRPARSVIFYGLRGVGKTVLLARLREEAEARRATVVSMEAPEGRSLPALLVPALRAALLRMERLRGAGEKVARALAALAGFVKLKATFGDLDLQLDFDAEPGLADSGDLELDLADLIGALGEAARERETAFILSIDELQYVPERELAAMTTALHRAAQRRLPVTLMGAGLPPLLGLFGRAKSYAERLFEFVPLDALPQADAEEAIRRPIEDEEETIDAAAIEAIVAATQGYPYFLQEWGKHSWDMAERSPITLGDVEDATVAALAELDASFFRVRLDRLTPSEKAYIRAMAQLGPGPHRSGDIAARLGRDVTSLAPVRNNVIAKGMLYSPAHGDTAFTVPLFDAFIRRVMP